MISSCVAAVQCPGSSDQTWKKAILGISPPVRRRLLIEIFITGPPGLHRPAVREMQPWMLNPWNQTWRFGDMMRMVSSGHWLRSWHEEWGNGDERMKVAVLSTLYLKSEHQHSIVDNYWKLWNICMNLQEKQLGCWCRVLVSDCHGQERRKNARSSSCCCSPARRSELRLEASSPNNSRGRNC